MENRITATELAKGLSDFLNRVKYRGEEFVVERNGEPIATLGPSGPSLGITLSQAAARLIDLTLPGDGFAEDLEAIQALQPSVEPPAWHS